MSKKLEEFNKIKDDLRLKQRLHRNTEKALTGNLPKKKLKKYAPVVTKAYVDMLNADQKASAAFKKLSATDKTAVLETV